MPSVSTLTGKVVRTIDERDGEIVEQYILLTDGTVDQLLAGLPSTTGLVEMREFSSQAPLESSLVYARRLAIPVGQAFDPDAFLGEPAPTRAPTAQLALDSVTPMSDAEFWSLLENTGTSDPALIALERRLRRLRAGRIRSFAASLDAASDGLDTRVLDAISAAVDRAHFTRTGTAARLRPALPSSRVGIRFIAAVGQGWFELVALDAAGGSRAAARIASSMGATVSSRVDSCDLDAEAPTNGTIVSRREPAQTVASAITLQPTCCGRRHPRVA